MKIYGMFLCIGTEEPSVTLLNAEQIAHFDEAISIAETRTRDPLTVRASVYAKTFGKGVQYAVPCWSDNAMVAIATGYSGAHQARVRQIAAACALGRPYSLDGGSSGTQGGQKAPIDPVKPKPTKPRGGARVTTDASVRA